MRWSEFRWSLYTPFYNPLLRALDEQRQTACERIAWPDLPTVFIPGCGTGLDLPYLPIQSRVWAMDTSSAMLKRCQHAATHLSLDVQYRQAPAEQSGLPDESVDVVLLHLILAITPTPQACMQEALRVLKPGGMISVWDKFLPDNQTASASRQLLNLFTRLVGTNINHRAADFLHLDKVKVLQRHYFMNHWFQHILLKKWGNA